MYKFGCEISIAHNTFELLDDEMKTHLAITVAFAFGALASSPAAYAFQDQGATQSGAQPTPPSSIIYFHENDDGHDHSHDNLDELLPGYQFTPRVEVSDTLDQVDSASPIGLFESFTPRRADAHLDFVYDRPSDDDVLARLQRRNRGFGFGVTSSINLANTMALGPTGNPMLDEAMRYESYELGVNVGYAGFSLDASLYKELGSDPVSPLGEAMQGFDLGLSYKRPKWSTSLTVGAYSSLKDEFLAINEAGFQSTMTAFHFGAVYKPLPSLHLTGGIRYLDMAHNPYLFEAADRQMVYLGTRLKF